MYVDNVAEQARITMENINFLLSPGNYPVNASSFEYKLLRIYIKKCNHMSIVSDYMAIHYPKIPKIYICADVCREDLLLEIEGIAEVRS